jgi:hypothetical protein
MEPSEAGQFGALGLYRSRWGVIMGHAERVHVARATKACWPFDAEPEASIPDEVQRLNGLASVLLAIEQKRGTLYMLDVSRCLLERWNLSTDQLQAQSDETRRLIDNILKS